MEFDCTTCGACCFMGFDVLLSPGDEDRFRATPRLQRLTVLQPSRIGPLRFLRKHPDGRCIALKGEVGRVACSIYADRPHLCRLFEAGSEECIDIRRRFGMPVPLDASDAAAAQERR